VQLVLPRSKNFDVMGDQNRLTPAFNKAIFNLPIEQANASNL
jgi:hypothetical protein